MMIAGLAVYTTAHWAVVYMMAPVVVLVVVLVVVCTLADATVTSPGILAARLRLHSSYCRCRNWEALHLEQQT